MFMTWEVGKATEVIVYVAERIRPQSGHARTHAILDVIYQADKLHLSRYSRTITRDTYAAYRRGVFPVLTNDLIYEDASDAFGFGEQGFVTALRTADLMKLSRSDTECLDETLERYHGVSRRAWRGGAMDWAWRIATDRGALFKDDGRDKTCPVSLVGIVLGLPNAADVLRNMHITGFDPYDPPEPETLDEALNRIGGWGRILRVAIERGEVIPPEVFLVSFRQLTPAERAYGRTLIPMVEAIRNREEV